MIHLARIWPYLYRRVNLPAFSTTIRAVESDVPQFLKFWAARRAQNAFGRRFNETRSLSEVHNLWDINKGFKEFQSLSKGCFDPSYITSNRLMLRCRKDSRDFTKTPDSSMHLNSKVHCHITVQYEQYITYILCM